MAKYAKTSIKATPKDGAQRGDLLHSDRAPAGYWGWLSAGSLLLLAALPSYGQTGAVESQASSVIERGLASWYGPGFQLRATANGERYDMYLYTAAHRTLPLPSYVLVRNTRNNRQVMVVVNDRGPFVDGRVIDLSFAAAKQLDMVGPGVVEVEILRLTQNQVSQWNGQASEVAAASPIREAAPTTVAHLGGLATLAGLSEAPKPDTPAPQVTVSPLPSTVSVDLAAVEPTVPVLPTEPQSASASASVPAVPLQLIAGLADPSAADETEKPVRVVEALGGDKAVDVSALAVADSAPPPRMVNLVATVAPIAPAPAKPISRSATGQSTSSTRLPAFAAGLQGFFETTVVLKPVEAAVPVASSEAVTVDRPVQLMAAFFPIKAAAALRSTTPAQVAGESLRTFVRFTPSEIGQKRTWVDDPVAVKFPVSVRAAARMPKQVFKPSSEQSLRAVKPVIASNRARPIRAVTRYSPIAAPSRPGLTSMRAQSADLSVIDRLEALGHRSWAGLFDALRGGPAKR